MKPWIDFRSDTVTNPTSEMREAMFQATVGDDVYQDDPTVAELESYAAKLIGKEAALFVPTGTFGNLLALYTHCDRGDEVIVGSDCHIAVHGTGSSLVAPAVKLRIIDTKKGMLSLDRVGNAIRRTGDIHYPKTGLICLENAHSNGYVLKPDYMNEIGELARNYGVPIHLDGSRLFNAAVHLEVDASEITQYVDSVMFCLSKGLCAPVGSILAGTREFILKARKNRRQMGGGMRQVGILAAAGLVALQTMHDKLRNDHILAQKLAEELAKLAAVKVHTDKVTINMVFCEIPTIDADKLVNYLWTNYKIKVLMPRNGVWRFVVHNNIALTDVQLLVKAICEFCGNLSIAENNPEALEATGTNSVSNDNLAKDNIEPLPNIEFLQDTAARDLFFSEDDNKNANLEYVNNGEQLQSTMKPPFDANSNLEPIVEEEAIDFKALLSADESTNTDAGNMTVSDHEQQPPTNSLEINNHNKLRIPIRFKMMPFPELEASPTKMTDFSFTPVDNNSFVPPIIEDDEIDSDSNEMTSFEFANKKLEKLPVLAEQVDLAEASLDDISGKVDISADGVVRTRGEARRRRETLKKRRENLESDQKYYWQNKLNEIESQAKMIESICLTENPINDGIAEEIIKGETLIEGVVAETSKVANSEAAAENPPNVSIFKGFKVNVPHLLSNYPNIKENFNLTSYLQKRKERNMESSDKDNFSEMSEDVLKNEHEVNDSSYPGNETLETDITLDFITGNPLEVDTNLDTFDTSDIADVSDIPDVTDGEDASITKEIAALDLLTDGQGKYNSLTNILAVRKQGDHQGEAQSNLEETIPYRKDDPNVDKGTFVEVSFGEEDSVTLDELLSQNKDD